MTAESKIKEVISDIGIPYIFENWATANIALDNSVFPVALNVLPVSGTYKLSNTRLLDCNNCMIAFLDKTDFDFDGEENGQIIERMKTLSKEFIKRINSCGYFKYTDSVNYSVVYDKLDVNVTGIVIELKLEEINGFNLC